MDVVTIAIAKKLASTGGVSITPEMIEEALKDSDVVRSSDIATIEQVLVSFEGLESRG